MHKPLVILGNDLAWNTNAIAIIKTEHHDIVKNPFDRENYTSKVIHVEQMFEDLTPTQLKKLSVGYRLDTMMKRYIELFNEYEVDHIIYEQVMNIKNGKTMSNITKTETVLLLAAYLTNTSIKGLSPSTIKQYITGKGNASKTEIEVALREHPLIDCSLVPRKYWKENEDHVRDAIAIANCWLIADSY